jgi:hypothetical protein
LDKQWGAKRLERNVQIRGIPNMKKGKSILVAFAAVLCCAGSALADISSIQHNLQGFGSDASFNSGTGVLTISSNVNNLLTVNEDGVNIGGVVSNAAITMQTNLSGLTGNTATFTGGSLTLQFNYNGIPRAIGGPIAGMEFSFQHLGGNVGQLDGDGLFTAAFVNLPGSGIWPDGGGLSSIDSLTLTFDTPSGWDWTDGFSQGETVYSLLPNDSAVPEPATLALLVGGGVLMLKRRK